jgi:hypothetical protein
MEIYFLIVVEPGKFSINDEDYALLPRWHLNAASSALKSNLILLIGSLLMDRIG